MCGVIRAPPRPGPGNDVLPYLPLRGPDYSIFVTMVENKLWPFQTRTRFDLQL